MQNQWNGKRVAFLGDSITDVDQVPTQKIYWQYLQLSLGIIPYVYGLSGHQWISIKGQAEKLKEEVGDEIDAITIFVGTNDFNGSRPLGEWYTLVPEEVENRCRVIPCLRREMNYDELTLRGCINTVMSYLKRTFPRQQIILLTPIHRGAASFSPDNIQLDERYPNQIGLYIDDYVNVVKEAGNVWSVPVIDLNSLCGLYPLDPTYAQYFRNGETDMLHPGTAGHERMAKTLHYQLLTLPSDFK